MLEKLERAFETATKNLKSAEENRMDVLIRESRIDNSEVEIMLKKALEARAKLDIFKSRNNMEEKITLNINCLLQKDVSNFISTKMGNIKVAINSMINSDSVIDLLAKEVGVAPVDTEDVEIQDDIRTILGFCSYLTSM